MKLLEALVQYTHLPVRSQHLDILRSDELAVLVVFLTGVALIVLVSGQALYKLFFGRGESRRLRGFEWVMIALGLAGSMCLAYGYFVEPYTLEVTRVTVPTAKLKAGARPIRVALISDLHCDPEPRTEGALPAVVAGTKPDLIFFAGDAINSPKALPVFKWVARSLSQIAPTYAVRGNHDVRQWRYIDLYKKTGVHELDGQAVQIPAGGSTIWLAGVAVDAESKIDHTLAAIPKGAFSVFLYHFPAQVFNVARKQVDLFCTGHTHGGQVRLPLYGAIITRSKVGKQFEAGNYKVDNTFVYVNRGIGMEGGLSPRVRFLDKPEVTLIEIVPAPLTASANNAKPN